MYFRTTMRYRKLKADRIFDGKGFLKDRVLVLDETGVVQDLLPSNEVSGDVEEVKGTVVPGLINCHCHLELSHLKGVIQPGTGLVAFLLSVIRQRGSVEVDKEALIAAAEKELYNNGVVAVADICNTADAVAVKQQSNIYWHSLIEVLNMRDEGALDKLQHCEGVLQQHTAKDLSAVLTPHAPYSVSARTLHEINNRTAGKIISVHNQETPAENELFQKGTGDFLQLYAALGSAASPFAVSRKSSLQTWLPYFTNGQTILLVHNTFIEEEDILFAQEHAQKHGLKIIYCLCPNANLYIEQALPPVDLLLKHNCHVVLGTDSYSSNWQLSIANEIKALKEKLPQLSLETLLQWATVNGAEALGLQHVGGFEKGKKPGVVLFNEQDFSVQRLV